MSIVSTSRWDIPQDAAQRIVRDAAPLLKQQGASSVHIGRIQAGSTDTGQTLVIVTYADWETFGQAMQAQNNDQRYQQQLQEAQKTGRLLSRTLMVTDEVQ